MKKMAECKSKMTKEEIEKAKRGIKNRKNRSLSGEAIISNKHKKTNLSQDELIQKRLHGLKKSISSAERKSFWDLFPGLSCLRSFSPPSPIPR